jgi:hypothetical protein
MDQAPKGGCGLAFALSVETHNRDRGASEAQRGANVLEAARPGGVCTIECAPSRRPQAAQPAQSDYAGFLVLSVPSRLIGKGSQGSIPPV